MNYIVLGSSFGDEAKGSIVSNILKNTPVRHDTKLVVRFNGGHQVGHTVVYNNVKHVFSNFGSGALQGVPSYWSEYCTIHPLGILNEYDVLINKGVTPKLIIDPMCPVTTPFDMFDMLHNRTTELHNNHGSVGVGFGATIARNETPYKLYAKDLKHKFVLEEKLKAIADYYNFGSRMNDNFIIGKFLKNVEELLSIETISIKHLSLNDYGFVVFEGGQGILLDQDHGFFPHVTRSNTTSKNAVELIKDNHIKVVYVTRSYLTRHGNGPLPYEGVNEGSIKKNENETNVFNDYQKEFRYAPLNLDLLIYSIETDSVYSGINRNNKILWVTCMDQVGEKISCVYKDNLTVMTFEEIEEIMLNYVGEVRTKHKE